MCEPRPKENIVQLMGKDSKKEARRTHQAITRAFAAKRNDKKPPRNYNDAGTTTTTTG